MSTKQLNDSDTSDILARMEREQAAQEHHGREAIAATCQQLAALGLTRVHISYDGCGDSGAVETVVGYAGESEVDLPKSIENTLVEAAEELLPGGWEINDGSFGELVIDVAGQKLRREHSWRVSETQYEEMEFELETPDSVAQQVDEPLGSDDERNDDDESDTDDKAIATEPEQFSADAATVRIVVACTNASGESDFAFVKIRCTPQQQDAGEHYLAAQDWAANNDYEGPFVVFDEYDVAGKRLLEFFQWGSAAVVDIAKR